MYETFALQKLDDRVLGFGRYDPFRPFLDCPPDRPLQRYGSNADGGKMFCDLGVLEAPCLLISLGSYNDYSFEQDLLAKTKCEIHSFDCTVDGFSVGPGRHFFHKKCIGMSEDPNFMTWAEVGGWRDGSGWMDFWMGG